MRSLTHNARHVFSFASKILRWLFHGGVVSNIPTVSRETRASAKFFIFNMTDTKQRIEEALKYFGFYGIGNFDLSPKDIEALISAIYSEDYPKHLKTLYDTLEKQRMG